jgi:hypothetical protein
MVGGNKWRRGKAGGYGRKMSILWRRGMVDRYGRKMDYLWRRGTVGGYENGLQVYVINALKKPM